MSKIRSRRPVLVILTVSLAVLGTAGIRHVASAGTAPIARPIAAAPAEIAYNALHNRMGIAMANTQSFTEARRPQGSNNLFVASETLTHANNPN